MVKVYDMVTCSMCAPDDDVRVEHRDPPRDFKDARAVPQPTAQLQETTAERGAELHPALRHQDVETFIAAVER